MSYRILLYAVLISETFKISFGKLTLAEGQGWEVSLPISTGTAVLVLVFAAMIYMEERSKRNPPRIGGGTQSGACR